MLFILFLDGAIMTKMINTNRVLSNSAITVIPNKCQCTPEMCTAPKNWRGGGGKTGGSLKIAADAITAVSHF